MTWLVLALEEVLAPVLALLVILRFLLSPRRGALRTLAAELPQRLGRPPREELKRLTQAPVWVHAASVGEVNAAAGLIARLKRRGLAVVVTTTTAGGRQRAQAIPGLDGAWLAPLDLWPAVSGFLDTVRPRLLIVVETELWPHMIELTARRGTPCALVNARMTDRSYARYRLLGPLVRPFLRRFSFVAAQTEQDEERFRSLGATRLERPGNLKFDLPGAGSASAEVRQAFAELGWGDCPVFAAGSTHPIEEGLVVDAFLRAKAGQPRLKLLIAPRHVERAEECARLLSERGICFSRWSARRAGAEAVLVDALGALSQLYALSMAAFVGGTLVPVGGHNLLEPALAGVPVLFGPHTSHAAQAARLLESSGGALCAADGAHLGALLEDLLAAPERAAGIGGLARKTAAGLQGAVGRTEALLAPLL